MVAEVDRVSTAKKNDLYRHDGKHGSYHVWKLRTEAALEMEGLLEVTVGTADPLPVMPTPLSEGATATEKKAHKEALEAHARAHERRKAEEQKAYALLVISSSDEMVRKFENEGINRKGSDAWRIIQKHYESQEPVRL